MYTQKEIIGYIAKITSGKKITECPFEHTSVICNSEQDETDFVEKIKQELKEEFPKATSIEIYLTLKYKSE